MGVRGRSREDGSRRRSDDSGFGGVPLDRPMGPSYLRFLRSARKSVHNRRERRRLFSYAHSRSVPISRGDLDRMPRLHVLRPEGREISWDLFNEPATESGTISVVECPVPPESEPGPPQAKATNTCASMVLEIRRGSRSSSSIMSAGPYEGASPDHWR